MVEYRVQTKREMLQQCLWCHRNYLFELRNLLLFRLEYGTVAQPSTLAASFSFHGQSVSFYLGSSSKL